MSKTYNSNEQVIKDANKAAACGMSYGEWVKNGRPEPTGEKAEKIKCYRKFRRNRVSCK